MLNLGQISSHQKQEAYLNKLKSSGTSQSTLARKQASLNTFNRFAAIKFPKSTTSKIVSTTSKSIKLAPSFNPLKILIPVTLFLLIGALTYGFFRQTIQQAVQSFAYPNTPTRPTRRLSFQGRLTDTTGTPITSPSNVKFGLWNAGTGGTELYNTGTGGTVVPDQNGIFSVLIGDQVGTEIPANIFTENQNIYLEITMNPSSSAETMTPRQQIASVGYALNSETLQGYPPLGVGQSNVVLVLDNTGVLNLGYTSPTFKSTAGTFGLEGQAMTLKATDTSNGSLNLNPDGTGNVNMIFEGTSAVGATGFLSLTNANLSGGALIYSNINNTNRGYDFINFQNYNPATTTLASRFRVDAYGNASIGGTMSAVNIAVSGNSNIGGTLNLTNTPQGVGTTVLYLSNTGVVTQGTLPATSSGIASGYNGLSIGGTAIGLGGTLNQNTNIGTSNFYLRFTGQTNQEALYINNAGDLGVGTTNAYANAQLSLEGGYLGLENGDFGGSRGIRFRNSADTGTASISGGGIYQASNDVLYLQDGATNITILRNSIGGEKLRITNSGIGITGGGIIYPSSDSTNGLSIANSSGTKFVGFDTTNQRVGIGTTIPNDTFSVNNQFTINSSGVAKAANGSTTTPSYSYLNDTSSGLYLNTTSDIRVSIGTTSVAQFTPLGMTIGKSLGYDTGATLRLSNSSSGGRNSLVLLNANTGVGSSSSALTWKNASNTTLWEMANDNGANGGQNFYLYDGLAGQYRWHVNSSGNMGIGTVNQTGKLSVVGSQGDTRSVSIDNREIKFRGDGVAHMSIFGPDTSKSYLTIQNTSSSSAVGTTGADLLTVLSSGSVGIGTTSPRGILQVGQDIGGTGPILTFLSAGTTGKFGVGTTNPVDTLEVVGNAVANTFVDRQNISYLLDPAQTSNTASSLSLTSTGSVRFNSTYNTGWKSIDTGNDTLIKLEAQSNSATNRGLILGIATTGAGGTMTPGLWDSQSLYLKNNGYIGIGTTNPSYRLEVAGSVRIGGTLFDTTSQAGTAGQVLMSTGTGVSWGSGSTPTNGLQYIGNSIGLGGTLVQNTTIGTSSFYLNFLGLGNTQSLYLASSGYIGIGTTTANAKLSLGNNVATGFLDTYGEYQILLFDAGGAGGSYGLGVKGSTLVMNSGAGAYSFDRAGNATTLYMDTSGNVGIGTTSPSGRLDVVNGTTNYLGTNQFADGIAELGSRGTGNRYSYIDFHGDDTYTDFGLRIIRNNTGANADSQISHRGTGQLAIRTEEAGSNIGLWTAAGERVRITDTGNVGIGTTVPRNGLELAKLDSNYITSLRIGGITGGNTGVGLSTETSRHQILFSSWRDTQTDTVGAKIAAINLNNWSAGNAAVQKTDLAFFTLGTTPTSTDNTTEKMRLTSNGYLGVGTTNPYAGLDVKGGAFFDGNLFNYNTNGVNGISDEASLVPNTGFEIVDPNNSNLAIGWTALMVGSSGLQTVTRETGSTMVTQGNAAVKITRGGTSGQGYILLSSCIPISQNRNYILSWIDIGTTSDNNGMYGAYEGYTTLSDCASRNIGAGTSGNSVQTYYGATAEGTLTKNTFKPHYTTPFNAGTGYKWARFGFRSNTFAVSGGTAYFDAFKAWTDDNYSSNTQGGVDLAENYPVNPDQNIEPGDLVALSPTLSTEAGINVLEKSTTPNQSTLFGVVSTKPGLVLDDSIPYTRAAIALAGRVPIKISPNSAPILAGDYITSSSYAGFGQKSLSAGKVIGQALESWTPESGKSTITILINNTYYTPQIFLTNSGHIQTNFVTDSKALASLGLESSQDAIVHANYDLVDQLGNTLNRTEQFSNILSAKIMTGLLEANNIVTNITTSKTTITKDLYTETISPLGNNTQIKINSDLNVAGNLLATDIATTKLIASEASISGTLYADRIVSKEGNFNDLLTSRVVALRTELQTFISSNTAPAMPPSTIASQIPLWSFDVGTSATEIKGDLKLSDNLIVAAKLQVQGQAQLASALVAHDLTIDQIQISQNYIKSSTNSLAIQPQKTGIVTILGDLLTLADNGSVTINGDLTVSGTIASSGVLTSNLIATDASISGTLTSGKLNIATDSATLIIAQDNNLNQTAGSSAQIISNASAGLATLPAGSTELIVQSNQLHSNSMVYLTPNSSTQNQVVYVKSKDDKSFTIGIDTPLPTSIPINWWIIN